MSKLVYLTLSHFNYQTRKFLLNRSGYSEQLEYELLSHNPLYELYWNHSSGLFEREPSAMREVSGSDYFCVSIPMSNLRDSVKDYLYDTFLKAKYLNFEHYFLANHRSLDSVFVYVPFKSRLCDKDNFETFKLSPKKESLKPLEKYFFFLNTDTNNSYILYNDNVEHRNSWNLFDDYTCYYNKKYGGFVVSLKHYDRLLSMGAKFVERYTDENSNVSEEYTDENCDLLEGYMFYLNEQTNNSYVLYNPNLKKYGKSWNLFDDYTCYYSKKYCGYIVSLKHYERLLSMGAKMAV